jgi:hypothetical protein
MLDLNQRLPPCKGDLTVFRRFPESANSLQIGLFCDRHFSQSFSRFARVAARLLHQHPWLTLRRLASRLAYYLLSAFNLADDLQLAFDGFQFALNAAAALFAGSLLIPLRRCISGFQDASPNFSVRIPKVAYVFVLPVVCR